MWLFLSNEEMKLGLNSLSVWFGALMVLLTFFGAIAFLFTDCLDDRLFGTKRTAFVIILFAYSIYRGFRLYQIFKKAKHENE